MKKDAKTKTTITLANNDKVLTITTTNNASKQTKKRDYKYVAFDKFVNALADGAKLQYKRVDEKDAFLRDVKAQSNGVIYHDYIFTIAQNAEQYARLQSVIDGNTDKRNAERDKNTATAQSIDALATERKKKHFEKIADADATLTTTKAQIVRALSLAIDSIDFVQADADTQKAITAQASAKIVLKTNIVSCLANLNAPRAKKAIDALAKAEHLRASMIVALLTARIENGTTPQNEFDAKILQKALDALAPLFDIVAPPAALYTDATDATRKHTKDADALKKALDNIVKAFDGAFSIIKAQ